MFSLQIKTDNAAFHEDDRSDEGEFPSGATLYECARILRSVAEDLEGDSTSGTILDANGNSVGEWRLTK